MTVVLHREKQEPSAKVINQALNVFRNVDTTPGMDEWFSVSPNWDLNVFDRDGIKASLYPVLDGVTDTSRSYELEI